MAAKDPKKIISDLFDSVEQYRIASAELDSTQRVTMPKVQVRGQLLELALKTYLAACNVYREGHDLVALATECADLGLTLTDDDWEHIISRLDEKYHRDDALDWKFPSRYPMEDRPTVIWITPGHAQMNGIVDSILDQAAEQGPEAHRHRERSRSEYQTKPPPKPHKCRVISKVLRRLRSLSRSRHAGEQ